MTIVPAGPVTIGTSAEDSRSRPAERPVRTIIINRPFALATFPVTVDQWESCVRAKACVALANQGAKDSPVINVHWQAAQGYLVWLSTRTGRAYRLPTEVEWERAARADTNTAYWWGNDPAAGLAICRDCGNRSIGPAVADDARANPFGLIDMLGNVWQWTADCYVPSLDALPTENLVVTVCEYRTIKGGSWQSGFDNIRAAARTGLSETFAARTVGFRPALDLPDQ